MIYQNPRVLMDWKMLDLFISSLQFEILATADLAIVLSFCKKRERGPMLRDAGARDCVSWIHWGNYPSCQDHPGG